MTEQNSTANTELLQKANSGDAQAQFELAHFYTNDGAMDSVTDNNAELAVEWLTKSAELGYADAQFTLGFYNMLFGKNPLGSILCNEWRDNFEIKSYFLPKFIPFILYQKILSQKIFKLADPDNIFTIENDESAIYWFCKAAEQNHDEAKFLLNNCYPENLTTFEKEESILINLANAYLNGAKNIAPNEALALRCFQEVAECPDDNDLTGEACFQTAKMYFDGTGVKVNYEKGMDFLLNAINHNHTEAQQWLENTYLHFTFSEFFCREDEEWCEYVYKWLSEELEINPRDQEVNFALGVLHACGKGTQQNQSEAFKYFFKFKCDDIDVTDINRPDEVFDFAYMYCDIYENCKKGFWYPRQQSGIYFSSKFHITSPKRGVYKVLPALVINYYFEKREFGLLNSYLEEIENIDHVFDQVSTRKHFKKTTLDAVKLSGELDLKNKNLQEQKEKMQKLVEQFTHTLGNVIFPDTIYQVAERLKNNTEYRKDVLLLNEAYHSEIIIKLQGELLRQRYANTNPEKFRQLIRSCRRSADSGDKTKSIAEILDYAASRVVARFLNQHNASLNSIRSQILSLCQVSLDALKQKFENDILLNHSMSPVEWIEQNLRPFKVLVSSPLWQKVHILAESHAEALLFGYFSEAIFNAFKYANHAASEFLTVEFGEFMIDNETYLTVGFGNPRGNGTADDLGTGKGLDAIREDLRQLNDTCKDANSLIVTRNGQSFQVVLFFQKDLLLDEVPMPKLKRKIAAE